jgi:hypothetical protein
MNRLGRTLTCLVAVAGVAALCQLSTAGAGTANHSKAKPLAKRAVRVTIRFEAKSVDATATWQSPRSTGGVAAAHIDRFTSYIWSTTPMQFLLTNAEATNAKTLFERTAEGKPNVTGSWSGVRTVVTTAPGFQHEDTCAFDGSGTVSAVPVLIRTNKGLDVRLTSRAGFFEYDDLGDAAGCYGSNSQLNIDPGLLFQARFTQVGVDAFPVLVVHMLDKTLDVPQAPSTIRVPVPNENYKADVSGGATFEVTNQGSVSVIMRVDKI